MQFPHKELEWGMLKMIQSFEHGPFYFLPMNFHIFTFIAIYDMLFSILFGRFIYGFGKSTFVNGSNVL